jgi:capsular exopolysaccharide synthesis family protein
MEVFASKVRSWSDVEGILQSSLLGEFGDFKKIPTQDRAHVMLKDVNDDAKEAFRALYSQLRLSSQIDAPKTILITSSVPSEGKSFIASNLAATFSTHKLRTLLIDGDLRRPVQHRSLGVSNAHGMLRWLEEGAEGAPDVKDPALGITEIAPNFEFLAAGGSSRNITELLDSNGRLVQLLNHLKTVYDIVIIDSPPAGVFPDSIALAESADELIFVTRFNTVTRQHARQVLDLLRKTGLSMPGVVLNGMPTGRGGALYYSSYGYNYHCYKYRSEYDSVSKKS